MNDQPLILRNEQPVSSVKYSVPINMIRAHN